LVFFKGERLGQGRENVRRYLKERKDLADELEAKIRELAGLPPLPTLASSTLLETPEVSPKAKKG
jgi:recombination protein RecA